jgi:hypothetical protein
MRQFRDAAGVQWTVYQTERNASAERRDHLLPAEYRRGWLVFESATEKRRLAPVPSHWSDLADDALVTLCASAVLQTRRARAADQPAAQESAEVADASIGSELRTVEQRLTESLSEVCESPEAEKLDTGELLRVGETLAIASEAAKKAASLRQKRRGKSSPVEKPAQEQPDG